MKWSFTDADIKKLLSHQLGFFLIKRSKEIELKIEKYLPETKKRIEKCFTGIKKKYYQINDEPEFVHTHGDHYATFLYFLGNTIFRSGKDQDLMTATFSLNKLLHGLDVYPEIKLPEIFMFVHPLGTVLGRAQYSNYLMVYQNVTIGSTEDGAFPAFGEGVVLFSGSSVIGSCQIGSDVIFGANSFVLKTNVASNTTVVGSYPQHRFLPNPQKTCSRFFQ